MNAVRGRKGFQRKAVAAAEISHGPTVETAAKLEPDVLLTMQHAGLISIDQERAAREMASIWLTLERSLGGFKQALGEGSHGGQRGYGLEGMPARYAHLLQYRHQPWASREIGKAVAPGLTRYGIVWRIVYLNWDWREVADTSQVEHDELLKAFRDSLDVYLSFAERDT